VRSPAQRINNDRMPLIAPHGGTLVDLRVPPAHAAELTAEASRLPSIILSDRAVCDLELLATGAFSPLRTFMNRDDYRRVLDEMRLASGALFSMPITLPVDPATDPTSGRVALRDTRGDLLAVMEIADRYAWDRDEFARAIAGTSDSRHPLVAELPRWGSVNLSGPLHVVALPRRPDFVELRLDAARTRARLAALGSSDVVAFQTRNPLHRVHEEMLHRAMAATGATLLLHPAVGLTRPGDVEYFVRVRTYKAVVEHYFDASRVLLALLPLAMRMAGPREAVWHAIIRRNHGANHFIVGRDHASPGVDSQGQPFYPPLAARELVTRLSGELGMRVVPFDELLYLPDEDRYEPVTSLPAGARTASISGTQVRNDYLARGRRLPEWFVRPEVTDILEDAFPARHRQGFCVWFTGLSGAGKSATADALAQLLMERGRALTVLDGDVVRTHLSKGLGFSKDDRDTNIRRIGFVAAEVVKHGGAVLCAAISPYRATRDECRAAIGTERFVEVFVDTPLAVCEQRDAKGLYARARRGEVSVRSCVWKRRNSRRRRTPGGSWRCSSTAASCAATERGGYWPATRWYTLPSARACASEDRTTLRR
jgi:sulfate adenylyltransferase